MITALHRRSSRTASRSTRCIRRKWFFRKHEEEPTTEVAIRRALAEDLYIVLPAFERRRRRSATPADRHQPAGQLDLARLRRPGVRHRHRAAAGAGVRLCAGEVPGRRRDDGAAAAAGAARRLGLRRRTRAVTSRAGAERTPIAKRKHEGESSACAAAVAADERLPMAPCCHGRARCAEARRDDRRGQEPEAVKAAFVAEYGEAELLGRPTRVSTGSPGCSRT